MFSSFGVELTLICTRILGSCDRMVTVSPRININLRHSASAFSGKATLNWSIIPIIRDKSFSASAKLFSMLDLASNPTVALNLLSSNSLMMESERSSLDVKRLPIRHVLIMDSSKVAISSFRNKISPSRVCLVEGLQMRHANPFLE